MLARSMYSTTLLRLFLYKIDKSLAVKTTLGYFVLKVVVVVVVVVFVFQSDCYRELNRNVWQHTVADARRAQCSFPPILRIIIIIIL